MSTELEIRMRHQEQRRALEEVLGKPYVRVGHDNASTAHQRLFSGYVAALRRAKAEAEDWWRGLIDAETAAIGDRKEAITNVEMRRPAGSVVHGGVIDVFRQAWMGCVSVNQTPGVSMVEPFELVFDWLLEHHLFDLLDYLGQLPYLPVGIDRRNEWL